MGSSFQKSLGTADLDFAVHDFGKSPVVKVAANFSTGCQSKTRG